MQGAYKKLLAEGRCWRAFRECPGGKEFLKELYSWSELNPLHPWLVWKVCDPCEFGVESEQIKRFIGMKIGVYNTSGKLDEIVTVVDIQPAGQDFKRGTLTAKLDDGKKITAHIASFQRWLENQPSFLGC